MRQKEKEVNKGCTFEQVTTVADWGSIPVEKVVWEKVRVLCIGIWGIDWPTWHQSLAKSCSQEVLAT